MEAIFRRTMLKIALGSSMAGSFVQSGVADEAPGDVLRVGRAAPNTTLDPHLLSNAPNNAVASQTLAYTTWIASPSQAVIPGNAATFPPVAGYIPGGTGTCNIPIAGAPTNDTGCVNPATALDPSSGGSFSVVTRIMARMASASATRGTSSVTAAESAHWVSCR